MSEGVDLQIAGHTVTVTSPDKVFFQARGDTKLDLIEYYLSVGDAVMRQMYDRPVLLQRFPNGAHGSNFFQKRIPDGAPDWLHTTTVLTPNGTPSRALVVDDIAHIIWAVNLGCLGFHSWPVRAADQDHCDELRIDLDPGPGTTYAMAIETAHETKRLLDDLGIISFIKTSGNRGLYVRASSRATTASPCAALRSRSLVTLERRRPDLITAAWWKEEGGERIFIDFNRTLRTRPCSRPGPFALDHAPVSASSFPWELLDTLKPHDMTIATVPAWVDEHGDAWAPMNDARSRCSRSSTWWPTTRPPDCWAPWPPVYPKMPGEPPRCAQPSQEAQARLTEPASQPALCQTSAITAQVTARQRLRKTGGRIRC